MADCRGAPDRRHTSDLYTRPGWADASVALAELDQGRATGDRGVLWLRSRLQKQLLSLGKFLDAHAGKVLFVGLLIIATFCVGLKSSTFHTEIEQLWAEPRPQEEAPQQDILSTHQMLIQTAVDPDSSLLHTHGLLEHLDILKKASEVTVTLFDITWKLKDICRSPGIPNYEQFSYIQHTYDKLNPCTIITPLDCFWEGSKLLGPDYPTALPKYKKNIKWTNLNPTDIVNWMKENLSNFDYELLDDLFRRGGITTGYQEKPCLNPKDPECPKTAPNFNSTKPLDIGAVLTNGCHGFLAKYMHWPEELIVGGVTKNRTGHIRHAKALQSVLQLMDKFELYEYYQLHYKVYHIGWTHEKAAMILNAWEKKFGQEIQRLKKNTSSSYSFHAFSTATLNKGLVEYMKMDYIRIGIVLAIVCIYGWMVQSGLAAFGTILLVAATAAGLGVSSLLGFPMNLLSTHVLPYLSVGLAMRDMFILLSTQNRNLSPSEILQRSGPTILTSTMLRSAAFLIGAIFPTPAIRIFCLQFAILAVFHGATLLFIFPTLLALQIRFRRAGVPCFRNESKIPPSENNNSNNNNNINNADPEHDANLLTAEVICQHKKSILALLVKRYLIGLILQPVMKVLLCLSYLGFISIFIYNGMKISCQVRLSSFLPATMDEYHYLEAQNRYFGFYNFYLVTTEVEYPLDQHLLYKYHSTLTNVPNVLKDSNGGLNMNNFWLANFREFLIDLQNQFHECHCANSDKWFANATENAVLAFRLLAQTGMVEFPVDKSQIFTKKLVVDGIIDPSAFYYYLSVWGTTDSFSYSSAQANLQPRPHQYSSVKTEHELIIRKSQRLNYAQMPFYLKDLRTTQKIMETLKQIKAISDEYNNLGIKNYPIGLIFSYFYQFIAFQQLLLIQLSLTITVGLIICCILIHWKKLWTALINILAGLLLLTYFDINAMTGPMGAFHFVVITRNVLLLYSGYQSALGGREKRVRMSLEITIDPILKGDIGLLISIGILATSQFEFIQLYIFQIAFISVCGSIINSLFAVPLILILLGPKSELQPLTHNDRISTPPPIPVQPPIQKPTSRVPKRTIPSSKSGGAVREPSLSTITEESNNQSIVVEPQVTVEYSTPETSSSGPFTTKVTATTNIKVEVVAPMYRPSKSTCGSSKCHRTKCNNRRQTQCRCCKQQDSESSDSSADTEPCANNS
ncbi:protein patched [Onthophagus taurus]|uniref:protein patched n=1 Tax=Onthophagus taurus TaxID=166361 RepID=UPI000C1FE059|nr:protein patched [Onthophagus taurus]